MPKEQPPPPPGPRKLWLIRTVDKVATGVSVLAVVILVLAIGGFAISLLTDVMSSSSTDAARRGENAEMRTLMDSLSGRGTTPGAGR